MNIRSPLPLLLFLCYYAMAFAQPGRQPATEQRVPGLDLGANRINWLHRLYPDLDGEGLTVSIKENRYDTTDIDLRLRHRSSPLASAYAATHASLMATLVGGAGNSSYAGRGVARAVRLTSADFLNLLPDGADYYRALGVSVQNHSYGVGVENFYGADAAAYDASVRELPYLTHVFSAGNRGDVVSEEGPYAGIPGYANLTGSFKMAKNVITVAAVENDLRISPQVSKGPAYDGRLKPDLSAAGQDGSSGAAALVSGVSVILQQVFQTLSDSLPPAALVRALLFNSAEDVGPPGIDYQSGFGHLNALRAVQTLQERHFHLGRLDQNQRDSLAIKTPPQASELKITLSWTDPPADPLAAKALINDLDLELYHPESGQSWRPWTLSVFPHPDSLAAPARRDRDTLNNHEQISLSNPPAGSFVLRIHGRHIAQGPQDFALAYDWEIADQFQWTHPAPGDHLAAGETAHLRWRSTLPDSPATLAYTLDEGKTWTSLSDQTRLDDETWLWTVPDTFAMAQLRLHTPSDTFFSPTFYIYQDLKLRVGFNCEGSVFLYWNGLDLTEEYIVYGLEERYLEPVAIVRDTFIELDKTTNPSFFYAVGPRLSDTPESLRSPAINYNFQGVGCYIRSFFAGLATDQRGRLQLALGTSFGIRSIVFEKLDEQNEFRPIGNLTAGPELDYEFFDANIREGLNIYRARLELLNGEVVYSNEDFLFFVRPETYRVFPNPVIDGESLNIISGTADESERIFYLFDGLGRQVGLLPLAIPVESLETDYLPEGVYFYQIRKDGRQQQTGKVVIVRN